MKRNRILSLLLCVLLAGGLTACGDAPEEAAETPVQGEEQSTREELDLTALSSTMVYSEVYNMMADPAGYEGCTVTMSGQFAVYQGYTDDGQEDPEQVYCACIIADATACCSQGLEFVLKGKAAYPADYPALGTEITVKGEFHTYEEGEYTYCHLTDAELL